MSHWKSSGLAIFAVVCLVGETIGFAHAQCNSLAADCATEWRSDGSVINLGGLPGTTSSIADSINGVGQVVGESGGIATEWRSDGSVINLGGLPGSTLSVALGINNAGQAVGESTVGGVETATEWRSDGSVINLGGLPRSTFTASTTRGRRWDSVRGPSLFLNPRHGR